MHKTSWYTVALPRWPVIRGGGIVLCLGMCLWTTQQAEAHSPVFPDHSAGSAETAVELEDETISKVVYAELVDPGEQVWIRFEGEAGQTVRLQLGVPAIDRLEDFRPSVALVGPGLPGVALAFAIPNDLGGVVLTRDEEPTFFHEPFTGTDSWVLGTLEATVPKSGRYYVVGYAPDEQVGKLWIAIGDREAFSLGELASFGQIVAAVRTFHEVAPTAIPCFLPVLGMGVVGFLGLRFKQGGR